MTGEPLSVERDAHERSSAVGENPGISGRGNGQVTERGISGSRHVVLTEAMMFGMDAEFVWSQYNKGRGLE